MSAARGASLEALQMLLDVGADLNARGDLHLTEHINDVRERRRQCLLSLSV